MRLALCRAVVAAAVLMATMVVHAQSDPWAPGLRFVSVAFHDVVDDERDLDGDAVTTDRLIAFFEWLRADGWTAITLDDVAAAHAGRKPLPAKAILVSFDDGYQSLYTRVWPLAQAYKVPVLAALVGSWMHGAPGSLVRYGDRDVPRERFISWDQAREMQRSGVVEFASHSFDLHRGVVGNPQGNEMPAASTALSDASGTRESEAATRARLQGDLRRSHAQLQRELGRAPRAIVWPFGRYTGVALDVAREAGFQYALTLEPAPATAARPLSLARFLPTDNPRLGEMAAALRFVTPLPAARRWVCVDAGASYSADPAEADWRLGAVIERLRTLGATAALIDPVQRNPGQPPKAWFPGSALPLAGDWLSRLSWQLQTRAGVDVYLRLPAADAGIDRSAFAAQMARLVPFTGLLIDEPSLLLPADDRDALAGAPWQVVQRRAKADRAALPAPAREALQAFDAARAHRPQLQLALLDRGDPTTTPLPATLADLSLRAATPDAKAAAPVARHAARRVGWWFDDGAIPPDAAALAQAARRLQARGATALGYCPDDGPGDRPAAAILVPGFSASTFPLRP